MVLCLQSLARALRSYMHVQKSEKIEKAKWENGTDSLRLPSSKKNSLFAAPAKPHSTPLCPRINT